VKQEECSRKLTDSSFKGRTSKRGRTFSCFTPYGK